MPTRLRRPNAAAIVATLLAALAVLLAPASPAAAHNALRAATPAQDARLATPPTQITLEFLQNLSPTFTTIVLTDASQRKIPTGEPVVAGAAGMVTINQPLANGSYTVAYRVVSADGHPVQGSYSFTVADPTASTAPDEPASDASDASSHRSDGPRPMLLAAGGIAVVAVIAAGAVVARRRRSVS
ncbi:copper resistance CopC family protein [Micromonospora sp. NPDC048999]|uniref:copper resistance CopC family protein n=1 Tax=Micromonospora sp. NPDC048999 TaxID=3155391 RepID=UPI0033F1A3F4